ncbi:AraC family transcriptional regulator [Marinicella meishanensis]|uniref:AraC family transcriptional regulator n=1 Tax=Marinicella meishanensis TaxID=2873263 RepID=UPI001CBE59FA|nr:helix-turn-helix domain-containing protein [Marinicella sp. NBU2979]
MNSLIASSSEFFGVSTLVQAGLFALIFLFLEVRERFSFLLLSGILVVIALIKTHELLFVFGAYHIYPGTFFFVLPFQWLLAPLVYYYIHIRYGEKERSSLKYIPHCLPFLIAAMICLDSLLNMKGDPPLNESILMNDFFNQTLIQFWWPVLQSIQMMTYLVFVIRFLKKQLSQQYNWHSNGVPIDAKFLQITSLVWLFLVIIDLFMTLAIFALANKQFYSFFSSLLVIADYLLVNVLIVSALSLYFKQKYVSLKNSGEPNRELALDHQEMTRILDLVIAYVKQSQCFLSPDLTLKELSKETKISPRDISLSINNMYQNSFYYFINEFRIKAAKKMLTEFPQSKIIDVAYEVGFNSKSSFNKMFKHFTGHTPSGFKKHGLVNY